MKYNPEKYHRRSIRLKGYNYSQEGTYFVTVCAQDRECLFGNVIDGEMVLNGAGRMLEKYWYEIKNKFSNIEIGQFVVMSNHLHGIIQIVGADLRVCPEKLGKHIGLPLHKIIQWFKTMTTNYYIRGVKTNIYEPFNKRLWQRNYYEHIIRDGNELSRIREYIMNNPLQWKFDRENVNRIQNVRAIHRLPLHKNQWQILEGKI